MSITIVAPSTPVGGAVAMIRLSGERSKFIVEKLCGKKFENFRRAYYVTADTGTVKDKCQAIVYSEGSSYTGEESAEIFCHGSEIIVKEIVEFCIKNGARLAEGGEFTLRAYQNKKIDLAEAEGILDLINSETVEQAISAYDSVDGKLSKKMMEIQNGLKEVIAAVDVAIDYPEENIERQTKDEAAKKLVPLSQEIDELINTYRDGYRIKNGIKVLICGKPNVGKSELFNALVGKKRAIVSDEAGTTRDFIESEYLYRGRKFLVVDTAGVRDTESSLEKMGMEMMFNEAKSADLILGVGIQNDEFDMETVQLPSECKILEVTNKCDIKSGKNFNVSAKTLIGIEELKKEIYRMTDFDVKGLKINNLRQYQALQAADEYIRSALSCALSLDCFASDLYNAYNKLGSVTGAIGSDEIISEIFIRFCVGK